MQSLRGIHRSTAGALPAFKQHRTSRIVPCIIHGRRPSLSQSTGTSKDAGSASSDSLSAAAIDQFEQVAAALVAKLQQYEDSKQDASSPLDGDLLDQFDVDEDTSLIDRPELPPFTLAASADTPYTPRKKRKEQIPIDALPKVAIVGRPNVGKSALFNRLAGSNLAVVYDYPGVTRDRLYTRAFWGDKEFVLIDTGGLMSDATRLPQEQQEAAFKSISADGLPAAIERQAAAGVAEADSVIVVVDGQLGLQAGDEEVLGWLRREHNDKKVLLAVNKCDNAQKADLMAADFWTTGFEPVPVSAISGTGTGDLMDALMKNLPPPTSLLPEEGVERKLSVAIIGRPNVGKSSLLNAICGEERSIVCDMSGTTRDAVDTEVVLDDGQKLVLIDTAGIRKRARVSDSKDGAEQLSVDRAIRAARRADVAVLVVDGSEGVTQQDYRLSELIAAEGKAVVLVVNKWDRVDPEVWTEETMVENIRFQLREVGWAQVVCTTATYGRRVPEVVEAIRVAGEQHRKRVSTATLNMVVREAVSWKGPPTTRGTNKQGRVYYATQVTTGPPTFILFVNETKLFPEDYRRYMERQMRDNIGFPGTPIRLYWRGKPKTKQLSAARQAAAGAAAANNIPRRKGKDGVKR